jgi:hypothetical protein
MALSTTFQLHPWAVTIGFVLMGGWGWKQEITDKLFTKLYPVHLAMRMNQTYHFINDVLVPAY